MNLNKLFPRLTISAKLAIAFVLVALIPLVIVAVVGTRSALAELRASVQAGLDHDMDLAQTTTSRALREVEQHVTYLAEIVGPEFVGLGGSGERSRQIAESYLVSDPSPLFRVKAIDEAGLLRFVVDRRAIGIDTAMEAQFEPLYQWTAAGLERDGRAILAIEVRSALDSSLVTPAVAVIAPLYQGDQRIGALVGEADAESLFDGLEVSAPGLTGGVTALVDEEERFLFHSEHKRDWASLLAAPGDLDLHAELPGEVVADLMSGSGGSMRLPDGRELSYRRISVGQTPPRSLVLYRVLPGAAINARIQQFLLAFGGLGIVLGLAVLGISAVAARQFSRPIYALRDAAGRLAAGEMPGPVHLETNDEIEDLANDFNLMATALAEHRAGLESLVEVRTRQLVQTEAHLGRIVTDAADAILALSQSGDITLWNRSAEELFGYSQETVLGRSAAEVLSPTDAQSHRWTESIDRVVGESERVVNYRTKVLTEGGELIPVTVTKSALHDEAGEVAGHSLIFRDERARTRLEEQMRRSERLAAISVMAGGIAHELNNPLSILGNRIELMQREAKRGDVSDSMLEDLEVLHKHVGRIGSVTSDLIRFAREDEDELGPVDVNSVVSRVTRLLGKIFVDAGLDLDVQASERIPHALGSDSVIETMVVNLLLNAQQATPRGGRVGIVTRLGQQGKSVQIEVHDSGPGVPDDIRRRVFEPFFTTKAEDGGTGLGLAVCRALVDRLGGKLELANRNGGGASFVISLPRKVEDFT